MNNNKEKRSNVLKVLKDKFLLTPFKYVSVFVAGVIFASGLVYAWNAVWHGTDWVQSGKVINAKNLGESLQFLYEKIEDLNTRLNNIGNSSTTNITIEDMPSGTVVAGCIADYIGEGNNSETALNHWCWGGASVRRNIWYINYSLYTYTCPQGTKTRRLWVKMRRDSDLGSVFLSEAYGALCIKL